MRFGQELRTKKDTVHFFGASDKVSAHARHKKSITLDQQRLRSIGWRVHDRFALSGYTFEG